MVNVAFTFAFTFTFAFRMVKVAFTFVACGTCLLLTEELGYLGCQQDC